MTFEIRYTEPDDAAAIHAMLTSPHVVDGTMRLPYASFASSVERIEPRDGRYQLTALDDHEVVGFGELVTHADVPRHAHAGEINIILTRVDRQGQGVGRALIKAMIDMSDDWLGIERLGLTVWTTNEHAIRIYEGFGFRIEGTLRRYVRWRGELIDAHVMGRLRSDMSDTV
jgi:putative acetyltransferase